MVYTHAMKDTTTKTSGGTTLTIELPAEASVPAPLLDPEFVRYALAGTLYARGLVSGREARALTGHPRREFEENMARYGFPMMPDDPASVAEELDAGL